MTQLCSSGVPLAHTSIRTHKDSASTDRLLSSYWSMNCFSLTVWHVHQCKLNLPVPQVGICNCGDNGFAMKRLRDQNAFQAFLTPLVFFVCLFVFHFIVVVVCLFFVFVFFVLFCFYLGGYWTHWFHPWLLDDGCIKLIFVVQLWKLFLKESFSWWEI